MLQVTNGEIVDETGHPIRLRGVGIGGWMNLENFINGFPGTEQGLRRAFAEVLGSGRATFFFERLLDHFLTDDDLAFIRASGANAVRLPINYRHFEADAAPFRYLDAGFERLERTVAACARQELYAILDLHAAPGGQNPDWHSDNATRQALFWQHPHFQGRFLGVWREIAKRFAGNPTIAGYNVLNEPVSNAPGGLFSYDYQPDWPSINTLYRRVVETIRTVDPGHPIFLEGDFFAQRFDGLAAPFDDNLVYSSHNYNAAGFGPGAYPGEIGDEPWDGARQERAFIDHEGTRFAREHGAPLWVGEFGAVFNGPPEERGDRLQALRDQIGVFEQHGAHWSLWTYKDLGVMGWVTLHPESEYMQRITPVLHAKHQLGTDFWMQWLPPGPARRLTNQLADLAVETRPAALDRSATRMFLAQAALSSYLGASLQPAFARLFKGLSESEIDRILASFALRNCVVQQDLMAVVQQHAMPRPAAA